MQNSDLLARWAEVAPRYRLHLNSFLRDEDDAHVFQVSALDEQQGVWIPVAVDPDMATSMRKGLDAVSDCVPGLVSHLDLSSDDDEDDGPPLPPDGGVNASMQRLLGRIVEVLPDIPESFGDRFLAASQSIVSTMDEMHTQVVDTASAIDALERLVQAVERVFPR